MSFLGGPSGSREAAEASEALVSKGGALETELQLSGTSPKLCAPPNPRHPRIASVGYPARLSVGTELSGLGPAKHSHPDRGSSSLGTSERQAGFSGLTQLFPRCVGLSAEPVCVAWGLG